MAMFAASLSTLKKRVSEAVKDAKEVVNDAVNEGVAAVKRATEDTGASSLEELGPPSVEADSTFRQLVSSSGGGLPDAPVLVRYEVQNGDDSDREAAAFPLAPAPGGITLGHVRKHFPMHGRFHFRFKAPSPDGGFGGLVWADLVSEADPVPVCRGEICLKALRIPDDADPMPVLQQIPGSALTAAALAAASASSPIGASRRSRAAVSASSASELAGSLAGAFGASTEAGAAFEPAPRIARSSPSPSPPPSEHRPASRSPAPASSGSPPGSPGPPDDLMEMDFGGIPASAGSASPPTSASPPPPPAVFDRDQLVREREERVEQAVRDAAARKKKLEDEEQQLKADKVKFSNALSAELDAWAKTPDGQSYKDIKVLISTMHSVTWRDCSWKELPLSALLGGPSAIKKAYFKAILVVHPDKQKDAPPEQQVRADRIFTALNEAFKLSDEK